MLTFPKTVWSRDKVEGIQQALAEVLLLSSCPVLVGTYYSSYSETAKLIGWPYYIQVQFCLASTSERELAAVFSLTNFYIK